MSKLGQIFVLFLMSLILSAGIHAGYYFEHENKIPNPMAKGDSKSQIKTVRTWVDGKKLKKENPLTEEMVIIDLSKSQVFGVNEKAKTYWNLNSKEYQKIATAQLFAMGVSMSKDGSITVPKVLFTPTGKMNKIAKYDAYEVKINLSRMKNLPKGYQMSSSIWLSDGLGLPKELLIDQLRISLNNPKGKEYKKLYKHWRDLDGYPIRTETIIKTPKGTIVSTETLKVFRKEKLEASIFRVPSGYKKIEDPVKRMMKMQKMMKAEQKKQLKKGAKKTIKRAGAK